ncbi:fumarylacetoacetate hydrolase family protein [Burkholderiales bacterium]|nr:fumarylacetoacetate hydrolase family protein [Burkholderiales bacterium]
MKDSSRKFKAAKILSDQRKNLVPIGPLPGVLRPNDESEGYLLQEYVNRLLNHPLGPVVGHKIGCTTSVMQRFLGVPTPCAGEIFSRTVLKESGCVPREGFNRVGVECEVVVSISETITLDTYLEASFSSLSVIDSVMVGMEIVDDRYEDFTSLGVPTLIADNFFDSGCVLGDAVHDWRQLDLNNLVGKTRVNGVVVGSGTSSLIMGSPINALDWFIKSRVSRGLSITKGQFVMLGSVVETKWLEAGDVAEVEMESLGSVSLMVE